MAEQPVDATWFELSTKALFTARSRLSPKSQRVAIRLRDHTGRDESYGLTLDEAEGLARSLHALCDEARKEDAGVAARERWRLARAELGEHS